MRIEAKRTPIAEGDLTPMIDMVFQLIIFFMVLVNFSQNEQLEFIQLPSSQLAKPPEGALEFPIILHVARNGNVWLGGEELTIQTLQIGLDRELAVLRAQGKPAEEANVIIRAHRDTSAGSVQEVIRVCQDRGLVRFALRVKEQRL
jgi:biopolymer transport protein ExbD